ncbi:MAG TPA: S8 family serine peptidase [Pseudobdellovibrionaceae bacterium]|nr:S8 family serine peptidase [Pseudobdellovibrionaceae bacterium]
MQKTLLLGCYFFSTLAWGAPRVEPRLQSLLNSPRESARVVKVMVDFPVQWSRPEERILNRMGVETALMRAAQRSQDLVLQTLRLQTSFVRGEVRVKRYWLTNSMMIAAPVATLRKLLSVDEPFTMRFPERFSLVQPFVHGRIAMEPKAFTYGLEKMRLPELRKKRPAADGRGVRVGILDTGIDESHPDLHGKVIAFADFSERDERAPYDDHGHGTHVAGTIAGGFASGTLIGVAPAARLVVG